MIPQEIFKGKFEEKEIVFDWYDSKRPEAKTCKKWVKGKDYLFYMNNTARGRNTKWYFPLCSLENYIELHKATEELKILKTILSK